MVLVYHARRSAQTPQHAVQRADRVAAAARRASAPRWHRSRFSPRALPLLCLLLAIWACSIGPHIGARPLPTTQRPAADLRLVIQIADQYLATPSVQILARVFEGTSPNGVSLAEHARLTCNGSDITPTSQGANFWHPCPRQPPGGSYRIVYTDEHGATTTMTVPVPAGTFAILSPRAGSTYPIPTNGLLTIRYTTPIPPPNGSVVISSVSAACNAALPTRSCGAVYASLQDTTTPTLGGGAGAVIAPRLGDRGRFAAAAGGGAGIATPAPAATPTPAAAPTSGGGMATATVTQRGGMGTITLKGDYTMFQPGPGTLALTVEARVTPDRGGFGAATAIFSDFLTASITWTR